MEKKEESSKRIPKILCLHGYTQNYPVFRVKSGPFRKLFKKSVEFHFVEAPHKINTEVEAEEKRCRDGDVDGDDNDDKEIDQRAWWFSKDNRTYAAMQPAEVCVGLEESMKLVKNTIAQDGPFDGILGFSQGAALLGLMCFSIPEFIDDFKFIIFMSGFKSNYHEHVPLYDKVIKIPSLHVIGTSDKVIPSSESEEFVKGFDKETAVVLYHDGGHYLPSKGMKPDYVAFLKKYG